MINIRSNASYLFYNFKNIASTIKNSSNLFIKKRENLYVILNSLLNALISKIKRRSISNIVVAKANEVSIIRKSNYYIILVYDDEALRDLLLIFIYMFIYY